MGSLFLLDLRQADGQYHLLLRVLQARRLRDHLINIQLRPQLSSLHRLQLPVVVLQVDFHHQVLSLPSLQLRQRPALWLQRTSEAERLAHTSQPDTLPLELPQQPLLDEE